MLSQTAEYALRAVVWLANHTDAPVTREDLAHATKVPPDYLSKVMQALRRSGLIIAQRGKSGGFTLIRTADEITILDVVNAVDRVQRIMECPLGIKGHGRKLCPLHARMDEAMVMIERVFRGTTIGELIHSASPIKPLCQIGVGRA
ncbi:MAG: Rrf2 family transcriptional regulator [Bryobacteraceae bacterium]